MSGTCPLPSALVFFLHAERRAPHRQELTDPPDYSPPPPPESDEEEEKETPLPAWMNVQPFPHSQSKKTQQSVQEVRRVGGKVEGGRVQ